MKTSLLAQTLVQEFATRVEFATRFDRVDVSLAILSFLSEGVDTADKTDRAQAIRLALLRSNHRSKPEDVIAEARSIMAWPPVVEPVVVPPPVVDINKRKVVVKGKRG